MNSEEIIWKIFQSEPYHMDLINIQLISAWILDFNMKG